MKQFEFTDRLRCSIDPISLTGLALAGAGAAAGTAASSLIGGSGGGGAAQTPAAPAAPPPPQATPTGQRTQPRPQQQTFIGAAATPPTQSGQKSLLGQ